MKQYQSSDGQIWNFPDCEEHFIMMLGINPEYQINIKKFILNHSHLFDFSHVLDIGANVGLWTRWFNKIGAKTIDCFEPMPANYECLVANTQDLTNVKLHNTALSDTPGNITLYTTPSNSNTGSATMFSVGSLTVPHIVDCATLDSFNLSPTFIKIDIQGAELLAFKGGVETLMRSKPGLIVECENGNIQAVEFLQKLGYRLLGKSKHDYLLKFYT
jgi:FkbM family methyltransferase